MTNFMILPDDLALDCLARVSRLDYPILSLVSKRFRYLLASKNLYQTRALLGHTESCIYVCLSHHTGPNPTLWFTLCRLTPNSSKKVLVPVSSPSIPPCSSSSQVAVVGPNIYVIGGLVHVRNKGFDPSSSVMVMDSRSREWHEAPSMNVARAFHSACVCDGKIYVTGGCKDINSTNWMEVFDTETQTWDFFPTPIEEIRRGSEYKSVAYKGAVYVKCEVENETYKLHKGTSWRGADSEMNRGWCRWASSLCVIKNVLYLYSQEICWYRSRNRSSTDHGKIYWYSSRDRSWKELDVEGLETCPRLPLRGNVKLIDYGGKMAVLWDEFEVGFGMKKKIWCAEIAIEKLFGEPLGMLKSFDVVSTTSELHSLAHALATTI